MRAVKRRRAPRRNPAAATLRKEADALLRAETLLAVAQAGGKLGIWDWNGATGEVHSTRELKALFGLPRGLRTERDLMYLARIHPEDRPAIRRVNREARREGRVPELLFRVLRPDGKVRWLESRHIRTIAQPGRSAPRMLGICMDVTERRARADELVLHAERLRIALKAEGLVVFHQDRKLRYTWVANPGLGASEADLLGRTDSEIMGAYRARELVAIKRGVLRTGKGVRREVRVSWDKGTGWYDLMVEPSRDADGRVTGIVCGAADITARVMAQQALEASRTRLRDLVDHQRDVLEAERAIIARDVHDHVGAILTGVRLKLAALATRQADEATRASLRDIAAAVDSAQEATRRVCARLKPVELEDLGLADSCRAYATEWGRTAGIRVLARIGPLRREPHAAVATDIFRALQELLTNVARHARASHVRISLSARERMIALRVADDGRGLPRGLRTQGFGLDGLRERVARRGGHFELRSTARGVDARIEIPLGLRG